MVQFNLLPDVKLQYIKARRMKRTVIVVASTIAGASLVVMILLFLAVSVFQKRHLDHLSADITRDSKKLEAIPDLNKILTVQNQLNSLPDLHKKKPVTTRLFGFVQQVTPEKATIANLNVDYITSTITIMGGADTLETVNKYADTIKFTTYAAADKSEKNAFSSVVLSSFAYADNGVTYQIDLKFDPYIFDSANSVALTVPNIVTTRSEIEKPDAIFKENSN